MNSRVHFYRYVGMFILLATFATACSTREPISSGQPPNVVILFADDLGYGDLSSYGHPVIRTPRIDGIASKGARLTSFYAMAPSCTPSRAALLTGRYPQRMGLSNVLMPASTNGIPEDELTIAELLRDRGYATAAIGKWHLGHAEDRFMPTNNGFDSYFGIPYSNDMQKPWVQTDVPLELYRDLDPVEFPVNQNTLTTRYTEEAVEFVEQSAGRPFFLYLAYSMPHLPIHTSDAFQGQSRAGLYGDVIETIDWSVGKVLDALDRKGVADNTLVVFTSDNGPWNNLPERMLQGGVEPWHTGSPGLLRGAKADTYEGGMRVPCVIRWPGVVGKGLVSADVFNTMDVFATAVAASGATIPQDRPIDGRDMRAALESGIGLPEKAMYYVRGNAVEAVRLNAWKLRLSNHMRPPDEIAIPPDPELFNLELDPRERYNRAAEYPERVEALSDSIHLFMEELAEFQN